MSKRYLLAENTIDESDIQDLIEWLKTNPRLTQGELVKEFERQFAGWLGIKYAVFVNSGSSANLLMYYALLLSGRLKNKKVIVPAISWPTSVAPAIQLGFEPIMCEAEAETFGLDPNYLEALLQKHDPAAMVVVHVLGVPNNMEALAELKKRYGFILMEDACAALGSRYGGTLVGNFGDISTFSFYFGHHISTIEGGMVLTNDEELHDLLLHSRSHGWAKDLAPEKEAALAGANSVIEFNRRFTFYHPGFNFRSTDLNARIGLSQMKKIDDVVRRRVQNHKRYQAGFHGDPNIKIQKNERADISSISFALMAQSLEHRAKIASALKANNIETRPLGGGNMSRQPFWKIRYGSQVFPFADQIHEACLHLPNHPGLAAEDIDFICETVKSARPT